MIAHAYYFTDARIKNYVAALLKDNWEIDIYALGEESDTANGTNFHSIMDKYYGESSIRFVTSYLLFFVKTL